MKVSLWNQTVAAPRVTTSTRLIHSIRSIFLPRSFRMAACASVATITTRVASSTGASWAPTTPPCTRKPKCSVANAAAASACPSAPLKTVKKRISGRKSSSSFMGTQTGAIPTRPRGTSGSAIVCHEIDRRRVDAIALPRGCGTVREHMAQMAAAVVAAHLHAHHAMAAVDDALDDLAVDRRPVAGPAAAGVELGAGLEQRRAAADATVLARFKVVPVLAGEGAFGGGVAGDLVLHRVQLLTPLGVGFLDGVGLAGIVAHEEQDTSRCWAQSGGRAASLGRTGSSNGRPKTFSSRSVSEKSPCSAARMAPSARWLRSTTAGLTASMRASPSGAVRGRQRASQASSASRSMNRSRSGSGSLSARDRRRKLSVKSALEAAISRSSSSTRAWSPSSSPASPSLARRRPSICCAKRSR
mmetsp:Transcript_57661/g.135726  ORF Transcript_57661/g.135726 Transcript_57661/m.135726 type:complete len:414 (+) Transcript_57661:2529-3770(+)